jgi:hypothetical protein
MPAFAAPLLGIAAALALGTWSRSGDLRREEAALAALARFGWMALFPAVASSSVLDPHWSTAHLLRNVERSWLLALVAGALVAGMVAPLSRAACRSTLSSTALLGGAACAGAAGLAGVVGLGRPRALLAHLAIGALGLAGFAVTLRAVREISAPDVR